MIFFLLETFGGVGVAIACFFFFKYKQPLLLNKRMLLIDSSTTRSCYILIVSFTPPPLVLTYHGKRVAYYRVGQGLLLISTDRSFTLSILYNAGIKTKSTHRSLQLCGESNMTCGSSHDG